MHVLEYIWKAAWSISDKGNPTPRPGSAAQAARCPPERAARVAAGIRGRRRFELAAEREGADAGGLPHRQERILDYATALAKGWPIATGVIEGALPRHLVKDRMERHPRAANAGAEHDRGDPGASPGPIIQTATGTSTGATTCAKNTNESATCALRESLTLAA